jgi:hypothetical protein
MVMIMEIFGVIPTGATQVIRVYASRDPVISWITISSGSRAVRT